MQDTAFENGRISKFQKVVTLTLDWVTLHTVVHHSSTSTCIPNFIKIEDFVDGRTFKTHFIRSTQKSRPKIRSHNHDHVPVKGDLSSICWDLAYLCTKFDHSIFSRSRDMIGAHQNLNVSRDLTTSLSGTICHPRASTC